MKYIYYLLAFVTILSLPCGWFFLRSDGDTYAAEISDKAFSVNGHVFTKDDFSALLKDKPHDLTAKQYLNSIIDKEIMIQEAIKLKIQDEPGFKHNIKTYYEQSLISVLMSRKASEFKGDVTEQEISNFIKKMNSVIEVTTYYYADLESAVRDLGKTDERNAKYDFSALSDNMKFIISSMEPGQKSSPLADEYGFKVFLVKSIENKKEPGISESNTMHDIAEKIIREGKKKAFMNKWQQDLKQAAIIDIKSIN